MDFEIMRDRLVEARNRIGCNRKQFAELLDIPYRTVTNYENGSREPGHDYIARVADVCGCTTDWLLGRSDIPAPIEPAVQDDTAERLLSACESLNQLAIEKVIQYVQDISWNPENLNRKNDV